jgi:hypothetical protein
MNQHFSNWKYIPILAISNAEITATEQLPDKDRDLLLPLFPLKGWLNAHKLQSALNKIEDAIGKRSWIADIDHKFLFENKVFLFTGEYPERPVFQEIKQLINPENAFNNWYEFIKNQEHAIPCLRTESLEDIDKQIQKLSSLNRGLVIRINPILDNIEKHKIIVNSIKQTNTKNILIIYDLGHVDSRFSERLPLLQSFIHESKSSIEDLTISVSASSFPYGFAGQSQGENSIYERMLYNELIEVESFEPIIYSDRGSARAEKQEGGAGTPPPRIDYPLKKDWKFVRREVDDDAPNAKERRRAAYEEISREIVSNSYWIPELRLWGTQQIEITAEGSDFGIYHALRSTAVRINIHLFNQLHYDSETSEIDTDEEWVD